MNFRGYIKEPCLLLDHKYIVYWAFQSCQGRQLGDPGVLLKILRIVFNALKAFSPKKVALCTDSSPYCRTLDGFPQYKSDRKRLSDDELLIFNEASNALKQVSHYLGIPFVEVPSAESDDLMYQYVMNDPDKRWIVLSSDSDLIGLHEYSNYVTQVRPSQNGDLILTDRQEALNRYPELKGRFWLCKLLFALDGGHNGAPSIPSLGKKTAKKIISSIPDEITSFDDAYQYILSTAKIGLHPLYKYRRPIDFNLRLQTFPYPTLDLCNLPEMGWSPNPEGFMATLVSVGVPEVVSAAFLSMVKCHKLTQDEAKLIINNIENPF